MMIGRHSRGATDGRSIALVHYLHARELILGYVHRRRADYANSYKAVANAVRRAFPFVVVRGNALPAGQLPRV
jgi:hypothetical protein